VIDHHVALGVAAEHELVLGLAERHHARAHLIAGARDDQVPGPPRRGGLRAHRDPAGRADVGRRIPDDEDCDHHPGEDHDGDDGDVDLPYDIRPALGATTTPIVDAFEEEGAQPAEIVSVTGATWRLAELQAGTSFVVTASDCDHAGNRDVGRDRVVVTWKNADGSTHSDHLDIRYSK
jgi:hypothetical protein